MPTSRRVFWSGPRLPNGARLLAPLILGGIAFTGASGAAERSGPPSPCKVEAFGAGSVQAVVDGRSFVLADGREVRLPGIEVPPLPGPQLAPQPARPETAASADAGTAAAAALSALVFGNEVVLKHSKPATDRYGRLLADAFVARDGGETSVTQTLVARGFARVAARADDACAAELRAAERAARAANLGLWGDPRYSLRQAENPAEVLADRGHFTLVEGKVVSVRESGGTIYLNFGRRWQQDFTVTIAKRKERQFTAAGVEPKRLSGRWVVVRGWVEERGGPWIEAAVPQQIEVVAER